MAKTRTFRTVLRTARDCRFSAALAKDAGARAGKPVVFLKFEGNYGPCSSFPTLADFVAGTNRTEHGWQTLAQAQRRATRLGGTLVTF